jgi:xylulokinase
MYDGAARRWSSAALDQQHLSRGLLPELGAPTERLGRILPRHADVSGLPVGTPILRGSNSLLASALSAGVSHPGRVMLKLGDTPGLFAPTAAWLEGRAIDGRLRATGHATRQLAAITSDFACPSGALGWYCATLCDGERLAAEMRGTDVVELLCEAASTSPPGAGGLLFLAFQLPRAALVGMTARSSKADVSRAVLEGIAHAVADLVAPLKRLAASGVMAPISELRLSGVLADRALFRALLADVLGCDVCLSNTPASPAHGAALLAACGISAGGLDALDAWVGIRQRTSPNPTSQHKQAEVYALHRALLQDLGRHSPGLDGIDPH